METSIPEQMWPGQATCSWMKQDFPILYFSVTKDPISRGETVNTSLGGNDHRYHHARWNGRDWIEEEIAFCRQQTLPR